MSLFLNRLHFQGGRMVTNNVEQVANALIVQWRCNGFRMDAR